jgi:dihydroorotate dehydrogenase
MYSLVRKILFWFDAEAVHYFAMNCLRIICSTGIARNILRKKFGPTEKKGTELWGLHFRNPVGLAAGFDKNARYLRELECLGFGFVEIGTVTPKAQAGNEKPRLFRLPKDKALINRMGFNNDGVKAVAARLKEWKASQHPANETNASGSNSLISGNRLIVGGNIGKNKLTPNEDRSEELGGLLCGERKLSQYTRPARIAGKRIAAKNSGALANHQPAASQAKTASPQNCTRSQFGTDRRCD